VSKKIFHVITGLNNGGAEAVLFRLCTYDKVHKHIVVSLIDAGKYGPLLQEKGIVVYSLNMPVGRVTISGLLNLYKLIKIHNPDIVQTWMYHADLIGGVVAKLAGIRTVLWNIRHSTLETGKSKRTTLLVAKLCAWLSHFLPEKIICCAHKAQKVHSTLGYDSTKMAVISNGYDLGMFKPSVEQYQAFRVECVVDSNVFFMGMVGRFDVQKDHFGLLGALSIVKKSGYKFKFSLIGKSLNSQNTMLVEKIHSFGLDKYLLLLDQRNDIPNVMNGLDCHVLSSSFGEAFPNVLAEAMACGIPCVTTDVGDATLIVGDTGWVVPPKDSHALARAIMNVMDEKKFKLKRWKERKVTARKRVEENFSIERMVGKYHEIWFPIDLN